MSDGGSCPLPVVDIKLLLSDNSGSKVWSGGSLSFALWYDFELIVSLVSFEIVYSLLGPSFIWPVLILVS